MAIADPGITFPPEGPAILILPNGMVYWSEQEDLHWARFHCATNSEIQENLNRNRPCIVRGFKITADLEMECGRIYWARLDSIQGILDYIRQHIKKEE